MSGHVLRVYRSANTDPAILCDQTLPFEDGLLAFSAVALASLAPKMLGSYRQRFAVYIWIGVMIFVFSYLVKVFKYKNGGGSKWLAGVFPSGCNIAELIQGVFWSRQVTHSVSSSDRCRCYLRVGSKHKCSCSLLCSPVAAVC